MGARASTTKATSYAKILASKKQELEQQKRFFTSQPKKGHMVSNRSIVFAYTSQLKKYDGSNDDGMNRLYTFDGSYHTPHPQGKLLTEDLPVVEPLNTLPDWCPGASYISLGDKVYCVGGGSEGYCHICRKQVCRYVAHRYVKSAYRWDISNNAWTNISDMNFGRCKPHLHFLGGKLYAIGGSFTPDLSDPVLFMEVFDEKYGCWSPVPLPDDYELTMKSIDPIHFFSATLEHKGCILFGFLTSLSFFSFTPPNSWMRYNPCKLNYYAEILFCSRRPALAVGNHLLWLLDNNQSMLHCLDSDSSRYLSISLLEWLPITEILLPRDVCLTHVEGNQFSLIWRYEQEDVDEQEANTTPLVQFDSECSHDAFHCCNFTINFKKAYENHSRGSGSGINKCDRDRVLYDGHSSGLNENDCGCIEVLSYGTIIAPNTYNGWIEDAFTACIYI